MRSRDFWCCRDPEKIMAKIAVITDPDTGIGFKLTGIDVYNAPSYQEAAGYIERFLKNKEYEIVAYSEDYSGEMPESLRRKLEESILPVFMALPSIQSWREGERGEEYITRVLQRALGSYIKIKR